MKKGQPLRRKTPLKSSSTLHSGSFGTGQRKPLPRRSKKTQRLYTEERIPLVKRLLAEHPLCLACPVFAEYDGLVTYRRHTSTEVHEIKSRGRGGSITDESNCLVVCRTCHSRITENPAEAEYLGLLISSWSKDLSTSSSDEPFFGPSSSS